MIRDDLRALADESYREFQAKLVPTIDIERILGVRMPVLRAYAKSVKSCKERDAFLEDLPHRYYDEDVLQALWINDIQDEEVLFRQLASFVPHIDNWAVCDAIKPTLLLLMDEGLVDRLRPWLHSSREFTCRLAMKLLMNRFVEKEFRSEVLALPLEAGAEGYYVDMMVGWFYATALAYDWKASIGYVTESGLSKTRQRMAIQKAVESYRITAAQKEYLRALRKTL